MGVINQFIGFLPYPRRRILQPSTVCIVYNYERLTILWGYYGDTMENITNYIIAVLDLTILDLPCIAMFKQRENGDLSSHVPATYVQTNPR